MKIESSKSYQINVESSKQQALALVIEVLYRCALTGFSAQQNAAAKNFDSILIDSSKGSLILIPAAQELESAPGLPGADSLQVMVRAFEFQARSGLGTD